MKNLLVALSILMSTCAFAQVTYGIKAGLNRTNQKNIHTGSDPRYGFHIGGFATIPISDNDQFYFQPEVLYSQQGEKNTTETINETYQLDYINVPLLFKPYFSEQDTEFYGIIGPQVGFLVSENIKDQQDTGYSDDEYNSFDFGLLAGIGFSYLRTWELEIRYLYGFSDTVEDDASNEDKNRTSNLHFSVGYRF